MAPIDCNVIIVQNTSGEFLGTKSTKGPKLVNVGTVPRIYVNKRLSPIAVKESKTSTPLDLMRRKSSEICDKLNVSVSPITASQGNVLDTVVESDFEQSFDLLKTGDIESTLQAKTSTVPSTTHSTFEGRLNIHDIDKDTSTENNVNGVEGQDTNTTKSLDDKNESAISIASTTCEDILQNQNIQLSGESTLVAPEVDNKTVVDKLSNSNESSVTVTKIECKDSDLSVTVTPSSSSLASNISDKESKQNEGFIPDSEELKEISTPTTNHIDSVMNDKVNERSQSEITCSQTEDEKNNQQEAASIRERPAAQNSTNQPEHEIVDEGLKNHPLNAEITDSLNKLMSPAAEIAENDKDVDTLHISENSTSILPANADALNDEAATLPMEKENVNNRNEVGGNITVPLNIKPLVDYDDIFTDGGDVTQPTVKDSENEDTPEESDSELTQEFVSLSEIPTSQLDTSIPSEFESNSEKEDTVEKNERNNGKADVEGEKKKKK